MFTIRDFRETDLNDLVALNNAEVPHVSALDLEEAAVLCASALSVLVVEQGGHMTGFVIVFEEGSSYSSPNYRWFSDAMDGFLYVDRIVVVQEAKGTGVGSALYAEVGKKAHERGVPVTCEVNLIPPNELSMEFHLRKGFVEVGQLGDGHKRVAMMSWTASVA